MKNKMTSYSLKIFRNSLLGLFGCLLSLNLIGQELPTVIPPSPEAAALFKSEEVPVSYYNGTTNYGIPIYTLQGNELSVPISINYNSSGIKVEEVSSWVGIGWSLNAGGTISRSIQGLPDEILKGYIFNEVFDENGIPIYTGCVYDNDRPPYAAMLANELDAKPDIFYFSYPGGSGKFVLDVHGKPVLLNREDILIEASFVEGEVFNQQWKITDKSGIQYMFGVFDGFSATESTGSNPFCTGSSSLPDPLSLISGNTSWYLRAMISADESDTIMFNYEPYSMKYDVHGGGYIDYRVFGNTNLGDKLINLCTKTEITHSSVRLKSIVSSKGSVEFVVNSEKRKDVESIGSNEDMFPKALSHIEIKDSFGNKVKKIVLEQSYLNASSDDYNTKRLQLDRIYTSNEAEDKDEQIFDFYYNTPPGGLYPSRLSNEQDYWGYYNGKGNGNLIPLVNYYNYYFGVTQELGDAIREVDFEYAKFCSLKKVNLPTGGNITFSYEPHSYFGTTSFVEYKSEEKIQGKVYVNTFADYPDPTSYDEVTFEVETSGSYSVRCNFNCTTPGGFSGCGFVALNSSDGSFSKTFSECTLNLLYLNPGTYTLSAEIADGEAEIEFDIFKVETDELAHEREENRVSGGLRIKAVRRDDGNGIPIVKKYFYTDQMGEGINSTGRNFYQNDFKETYTYVDGSYENLGCYGENGATGYIRLKAKSNVPLGYKSSYNVGYKEVTVWHGENGEFGKEHHLYTPSGSGRLLSQYSHRNMAPVEQSYFTGDNRLVKKVHYDYETRRDLSNRVLGLEVETDKKSPCWKCRHTEYSTYTFEYDSEWFKLIKKTEITYPIDEGDNTPFEVVTDYVYDPDQEYDNPKTIITQNSDGTLSKQHFYYAYSCDDSTYGSNLLRDKHMHSQLLKKEIEVDGAIVSKTETYFSDEDESAEGYNIVPTKVINYPKGGDEGIKINYDFDEEGNIIEVQRENDIYHSYVWGYNNTLPVFKIINAPYSLVESKLTAYKSILEGYPTKENIKEIWQHLSDQLPEDVQIMGYGFEPLKGMNMAIDINGNPSYFDYDDFNRLQYVKDYDEKLLQKYEYHYIKN